MFWLEVDETAQIEQPIEIMFISTGQENSLAQPRNILIANEKSQIKIIERYLSLNDNKSMTNTITEIYCEENAKLEHVRIQQESRAVNHISGTFVKLEQDSHFSTSTITLGGNLTRNDLRCQISGTGAHGNMYGLYGANQRQHVDNFTQVEHQVANCTSDELYKGVLDDRSRAVFSWANLRCPGCAAKLMHIKTIERYYYHVKPKLILNRSWRFTPMMLNARTVLRLVN